MKYSLVLLFAAIYSQQALAVETKILVGSYLTSPLSLSINLGTIIGTTDTINKSREMQGIVMSIEPGIHGTKTHLGFGHIYLSSQNNYKITWTELRMRNASGNFSTNEDYAGIEVDFGAVMLRLKIGYLRGKETNKGFYTFGFGAGI